MGLVEFYDYHWNQRADPRTNNLPLIGSIYIIPSLIFVYLYFVLKWGPEFMKDRKPADLKTYAKFYNIFQIISNSYLVYRFLDAGWFREITLFCELPDYSYAPGPYKVAMTMWVMTMIKVIDLSETVVYVLRKKYNQISFLHVYHHVSTVLIAWISTKYVPVAMASFTPLVNCGVHVIMYTYYLLSTGGPKTRQAVVKFKPMLTILQMTQFVILLFHTIQSLMPHCQVTRVPGIVLSLNLIINFVLFYNFYQKRYVKSAQKIA